MSNYYDVKQFVVPNSLKTSMNSVLNKKLGTTSVNYDPRTWAANVGAMVPLPVKTATGSIAHFEDGADDVPLKSLTAQILPIQSGTGDPSPSNPRPISGTSVLNVEQRGVNVWDEQWELGDINSTTGEKIPSNYSIRSKNFIPCKPETSYYKYIGNNKANCIYYYDVNQNFLSRDTNGNSTSRAITTPTGCYYMKFATYSTYGTTYLDDMAINYPSTATTYEPYTGSTYTVNLGQTVYGGTADVVGGTGEETKIVFDFGSEDLTWIYNPNQTRFYCTIPNIDLPTSYGTVADILCSCYKTVKFTDVTGTQTDDIIAGVTQGGTNYVTCRDTRYTDAQSFKTGLTGQKFVVNLVTPTDFTFEGEEVNTFYGANNIWADSGDVEVKYRADMNLLISELGG